MPWFCIGGGVGMRQRAPLVSRYTRSPSPGARNGKSASVSSGNSSRKRARVDDRAREAVLAEAVRLLQDRDLDLAQPAAAARCPSCTSRASSIAPARPAGPAAHEDHVHLDRVAARRLAQQQARPAAAAAGAARGSGAPASGAPGRTAVVVRSAPLGAQRPAVRWPVPWLAPRPPRPAAREWARQPGVSAAAAAPARYRGRPAPTPRRPP